MRLGLERVPEKDEEIDLVVDDLGTDLLVASERSTLQFSDLEASFSRIFPVVPVANT